MRDVRRPERAGILLDVTLQKSVRNNGSCECQAMMSRTILMHVCARLPLLIAKRPLLPTDGARTR